MRLQVKLGQGQPWTERSPEEILEFLKPLTEWAAQNTTDYLTRFPEALLQVNEGKVNYLLKTITPLIEAIAEGYEPDPVEEWIEEVLLEQSKNERMINNNGQTYFN